MKVTITEWEWIESPHNPRWERSIKWIIDPSLRVGSGKILMVVAKDRYKNKWMARVNKVPIPSDDAPKATKFYFNSDIEAKAIADSLFEALGKALTRKKQDDIT